MKPLILVCLAILLGCASPQPKISRTINVTIHVKDGGSVYFSPEVLAEISKEADAKSKIDQKTEVEVPIKVVP